MKFSVVIPYKQRLDQLRIALAALADQTMDRSDFEVVVGVMEYSPEYVQLCQEFIDRLNIVSVMAAGDWNVSRARNIALRQASGEVALLLDADMATPNTLLDHLYRRYFSDQRDVCVVGQLVNYRSNRDVQTPVVQPYPHYRALLAQRQATTGVREDPRWQLESLPLAWSIVWTALVALPTATIRRHGLYFDESFQGWGVEDQEWGFRIAAAGVPIIRGEDVYAIHLPHARDSAANTRTARRNLWRFVTKWQQPEVELVAALEWKGANRVFAEVTDELRRVNEADGYRLGVARGPVDGTDTLFVGAKIDSGRRPLGDGIPLPFDDGHPREVFTLVGFALPYDDKTVTECRVLPPIHELSPPYRDLVLREVDRVGRRIVTPIPR